MMEAHSTYDSYRESGVEWLGAIPRGWQTRKLKFITQIIKRIAGHEGPDVLSITQQGIKVKDITSGEGQLADDYSNYQLVYRGDFAMNHMDLLTGYVDISQFDGVVSPDYRVFRRTSEELDDRYLLLIFQIGYKQRIFFRYGQGVSLLGRWRFPAESFKEFQIPIPPLHEQRAIAAFLDDKCAKIDGAVKIKEDQIALLRERRQIIIQNAVTQGLNPVARMKDSGIDWIGRIPAHWEIRRGKHLFSRVNRPVRKQDEIVTCFRDGQVTLRSNRRTEGFTNALQEHGYQGIRKGDLVIHAMDAFAGAIGVSDSDGKATPVYSVCVPQRSNEVDPFFFAQLIRQIALSGLLIAIAKGIRERSTDFRYNDFANLWLAVPPLSEQTQITSYIRTISEQIENGVFMKQEQIAALKEYRTSLINAAVTGKIKVI